MKAIKKCTSSCSAYLFYALILLAATNASASLMTFSDKVDPSSDVLISFGNNISYSFTHSLLADQDGAGSYWSGDYGFDLLTDTSADIFLTLRFADESADTAPESVQFTFDGQPFGDSVITSGGGIFSRTFSIGLADLLGDGFLNITLRNAGTTSGTQDLRSDFYFLDSTLTVSVAKNIRALQGPLQVPLPTTIALLGIGLAGLGLSQRRRKLNL